MAVPVPRNTKRYLGLQFVSSGTHSAGKIWGGIVRDEGDGTIYPYVTGF